VVPGSGKQHLLSLTVTNMKFVSIIALLTAPFAASATRISWNSGYDSATEPLTAVACSDGSNGMIGKGYNLFGDLPTFPNIGGSSAVASWNSPNCGPSRVIEFDSVPAPVAHRIIGTCWNVTYQSETIVVTVIDHADEGYNLSEEAMNALTCVNFMSSFSLGSFVDAGCSNGQAELLGVVDGTGVQIPNSYCGLK